MIITSDRHMLDLPYGSLVRVTPREGESYTGQVTLCWLCVDEPAFKVRVPDGNETTCYPLMGDTVEVLHAVPEPERSAAK